MDPIRWAILGTGHMADGIAAAVESLPDTEATAVLSRSPERGRAFADRHGISAVATNLEAVLERDDVDVVYVGTPNAMHADQAIRSVLSGRHVLCDKPLALRAEDAERVSNAAAATGVLLSVNFQVRHHPDARWIREALGSGVLGEPQLIRASIGMGTEPLVGWRADGDLAGAAAVHNLGGHAFDTICYLLDDQVAQVTALMHPPAGSPDRTLLALLRFRRGTLGAVQVSQELPGDDLVIDIRASGGSIRWDGWLAPYRSGYVEIVVGGKTDHRASASPDAYRRLVDAFVDAIRTGRQPDPTPGEAIHAVRLAEAVVGSARTGRLVAIS